MHKNLIELIREAHGGNLNLSDDVYYLKLKDAIVCLYLDSDEKTLKLNVETFDEDSTYIYYKEDVSVSDLI